MKTTTRNQNYCEDEIVGVVGLKALDSNDQLVQF